MSLGRCCNLNGTFLKLKPQYEGWAQEHRNADRNKIALKKSTQYLLQVQAQ